MTDHYLKQELYKLMQQDSTLFDFLQDGSLDGVWYWDLENPEQEWMSDRFWQTLGYAPEEKPQRADAWQEVIFQEDLPVVLDNFRRHKEDPNHPYDQIVRYHHKDGSTVWIRCRGLVIKNAEGKPIRMLGAHNDLTMVMALKNEVLEAGKLRQTNEDLSLAAMTDFLTGCYNRRGLDCHFDYISKLAFRNLKPLSLAIIDIDYFKQVNDQHGHLLGDKILQALHPLMQSHCRDIDVISRLGGDEFCIIMPETSQEEAINISDRIRATIEKEPFEKQHITVSIGIATHTLKQRTAAPALLEKFLSEADRALYRVKDIGRNIVIHYNDCD